MPDDAECLELPSGAVVGEYARTSGYPGTTVKMCLMPVQINRTATVPHAHRMHRCICCACLQALTVGLPNRRHQTFPCTTDSTCLDSDSAPEVTQLASVVAVLVRSSCADQIDECYSIPCSTVAFTDEVGTYSCVYTWLGGDSATRTPTTAIQSCMNNGDVSTGNGFVTSSGWRGAHCKRCRSMYRGW